MVWWLVLVVILAAAGSYLVLSSPNKAIRFEEAVQTARSDVSVQEKRRVDLVYNLADCVRQYDAHESELLVRLAQEMAGGRESRQPEEILSAVLYAFPQLKSSENYRQLMLELSMSENLIGRARENYNAAVTSYYQYVRKFPTKQFLSLAGYEEKAYQRIAFSVSSDAPRDLFGHPEKEGM